MKVIISCLNSKFIHASLSPWCLLAGVKEFCKESHDTVIFEDTINGNIQEFTKKLIDEEPDVVAFSCYIWNIEKTLEVCQIIKQNSDCKIVLGGPEVAYRSSDILEKYAFIDYVLSGEGEWTFPDFLNNFSDDLSCVSGLTYRNNGDIIVIPEKTYTDTPPSPYCDEFYKNLNGRIAYIETSRGCPYSCAFCLSGRCSPLRFFDIEKVKSDILELSSSGTQTLKFVDRTFNANEKRANEILSFIKDNYDKSIPRGICFHFEIAGDILKESTLEILSSMPYGTVQLEIGLQTFNEETLKKVNRKTNTQTLLHNINRLISFKNMHIHIDLIAGLTGEDFSSFKNSFNTAYSLKAHMLQMGFLKLLHGAEMREKPEKHPCTFTNKPPYEVTSTEVLSFDEIKTLKKCEDAVDRLYNSGRFLFTLDYLIEDIGLSPFDVFCNFGVCVDGSRMKLSDYAVKLYEYFGNKCDKEILREKILCDLMCCSSALQIPEIFKVKDPRHKQLKKYFTQNVDKNIKVAILHSRNQVFAVNQGGAKDFHNRYQGKFYNLDEIEL